MYFQSSSEDYVCLVTCCYISINMEYAMPTYSYENWELMREKREQSRQENE